MPLIVDQAKASSLNLRTGPKPAEIIAVLPAGTRVDFLEKHEEFKTWWRVHAHLGHSTTEGFLHSGYLIEVDDGAVFSPEVQGDFPECHLPTRGHKRSQGSGRAYPLDEVGMPERTTADPDKVVSIIKFLRPDASTNLRYLPTGSRTFCNIYAYDFCQRLGVYLPRVWWMDGALASVRSGTVPVVAYGTTVSEMNANMLHKWFDEYSGNFGWFRIFDMDDAQKRANLGQAVIIVAKRKDLSRSGHINAVVPEHDGIAAYRKDGKVKRPVQSQAGSRNFTAECTGRYWWLGSQFQSFSIWCHE